MVVVLAWLLSVTFENTPRGQVLASQKQTKIWPFSKIKKHSPIVIGLFRNITQVPQELCKILLSDSGVFMDF